jgi:transcriptional regulator GlxA family with amidase domain
MRQRTVGILIFDGVEVLDFCGPFEVFATTAMPDAGPPDEEARPFRVLTIAERQGTVRATGGLLVQPHHTIEDHPPLDILVVPGGYGTRREATNDRLLNWIAAQDARTELTTSVCTGAFLLAARGILDARPATTHWASIERLRSTHPAVQVREEVRFVDDGRVITSAGVSAGIDMALHVVGRLLGEDVALATARRMEYEGYRA